MSAIRMITKTTRRRVAVELDPSVDAHLVRQGCRPAIDAIDQQIALFKIRARAALARVRPHLSGTSFTSSSAPGFGPGRYAATLTSEEAAISADNLLQHAGLLTGTSITQRGEHWTVTGTAQLGASSVLIAAE